LIIILTTAKGIFLPFIWMATRQMNQISRTREKDETAGLVKIPVDMDTEEIV
jgi:pyruvate/2-oxoglutarate dehydrogenase complex dihydrolipoamide dehydrogenase (E3) component